MKKYTALLALWGGFLGALSPVKALAYSPECQKAAETQMIYCADKTRLMQNQCVDFCFGKTEDVCSDFIEDKDLRKLLVEDYQKLKKGIPVTPGQDPDNPSGGNQPGGGGAPHGSGGNPNDGPPGGGTHGGGPPGGGPPGGGSGGAPGGSPPNGGDSSGFPGGSGGLPGGNGASGSFPGGNGASGSFPGGNGASGSFPGGSGGSGGFPGGSGAMTSPPSADDIRRQMETGESGPTGGVNMSSMMKMMGMEGMAAPSVVIGGQFAFAKPAGMQNGSPFGMPGAEGGKIPAGMPSGFPGGEMDKYGKPAPPGGETGGMPPGDNPQFASIPGGMADGMPPENGPFAGHEKPGSASMPGLGYPASGGFHGGDGAAGFPAGGPPEGAAAMGMPPEGGASGRIASAHMPEDTRGNDSGDKYSARNAAASLRQAASTGKAPPHASGMLVAVRETGGNSAAAHRMSGAGNINTGSTTQPLQNDAASGEEEQSRPKWYKAILLGVLGLASLVLVFPQWHKE